MEDEKSDINMLALSGEGALCIQEGTFILMEGRSTKNRLPINPEWGPTLKI